MTNELLNTTQGERAAGASPVIPASVEWLVRYRTNPWLFLTECVWTQDEVDKKNPVKQYPGWEYQKLLVKFITDDTIDKLALVKHRRMMATWTCCALAVWEILFYEGRRVALISKKEEASDELVKKCKFIYDSIPRRRMPFKPELKYKWTELGNASLDSVIKGFPQGADQLRQYTFSTIYADEFAFWDKAEESWTSMKPTLEGGGRAILFSTRFPGFFQRIVEDTIDER